MYGNGNKFKTNFQDIKINDSFDPNLINRTFKLNILKRFEEIRLLNPGKTQQDICNVMKISDRTLRNYRKDLNVE